jgi:hypothetical protein
MTTTFSSFQAQGHGHQVEAHRKKRAGPISASRHEAANVNTRKLPALSIRRLKNHHRDDCFHLLNNIRHYLALTLTLSILPRMTSNTSLEQAYLFTSCLILAFIILLLHGCLSFSMLIPPVVSFTHCIDHLT